MKRKERAITRAGFDSSSELHRGLARHARHFLVALGLGLAAQGALAMPPGWTKGCSRPIYGSVETACATSLQTPGSFFTVDLTRGICQIFTAEIDRRRVVGLLARIAATGHQCCKHHIG